MGIRMAPFSLLFSSFFLSFSFPILFMILELSFEGERETDGIDIGDMSSGIQELSRAPKCIIQGVKGFRIDCDIKSNSL